MLPLSMKVLVSVDSPTDYLGNLHASRPQHLTPANFLNSPLKTIPLEHGPTSPLTRSRSIHTPNEHPT